MFERAFDKFIRAVELTLAGAFIFAVCLNVVNVIGRYGLGRTLLWADEVQIYIMVWMAFLGAVVASWRNMHLRMDLVVKSLPGGLQKLITILEVVLIVTLIGFALWHSWDYLDRILMLGQKSDVGGIPMVIPHSALVVGFALIAFIALWRGGALLMRRRFPGQDREDGEA